MVAFVFGFGAKLVALRKESVDRNQVAVHFVTLSALSLSARRAWIEIKACITIITICTVALRKESVDRNHIRHTTSPRPSVALRKESVDRNGKVLKKETGPISRSPQGERG